MERGTVEHDGDMEPHWADKTGRDKHMDLAENTYFTIENRLHSPLILLHQFESANHYIPSISESVDSKYNK